MSDVKLIRVMIVDDYEVVRRGLSFFLLAFSDLTLAGTARNGVEAIALCATTAPDVVLMDVVMPEMDGIMATEQIRQQYPHVQIVALTSFHDEETVQRMTQAGAVGYVVKHTNIDELACAIRRAAGAHC
jgi:DNA-binding NarL/FixJ family response regulator